MATSRKSNYKLAASFICGDPLNLGEDLQLLIKGKIDYIHFDVMDGLFVPRYGLYPEIVTAIRKQTDIPLDLHMMVEDAESYIETFVKAGASLPDDIFVFHLESTRHAHRVIRKIHSYGIKAGVALNPGTPLHELTYLLDELDLIMLMAINPGIVGHKLIENMLNKIEHLKEMIGDKNIIIEIDGGVNTESAPKMIKGGATMLVCGTQTIYRPQEAPLDVKIKEMRAILNKA